MSSATDRSLYIDGQVFQSAAWHRGMGRYSLHLLRALSRSGFFDTYGQVKLILRSGASEDPGVEPALRDACPEAELLRSELSDRVSHAERNKRALEREISKSGSGEVDFLILSLFLESAPVFPFRGRKMLIVYDLIPLLYPRLYGQAPRFFPDYYLPRFRTLFEADILFPISRTIGEDLITHLGIPASRIKPVGGGGTLADDGPDETPGTAGLEPPFVLMPSGDELRKNNVRGAQGFQRFLERTGAPHQLVVTSGFTERSMAEMQQACSRVLFTGNVTDARLRWLFKQSEFVFFPTEYEGLGLPVLEALRYNKPVAASDIPSFKEMSPSALYFFDPLDTDSIANTLERASDRDSFDDKVSSYASVLDEFSWEQTARRFIAGSRDEPISVRPRKRRLAILAPEPSGASTIARTVARTHAELSRYFAIDYFFEPAGDREAVRPDFLSPISTASPTQAFNARSYANYDAVVYHIANDVDHLQAIERALHLPGFVLLYDATLDILFSELSSRPAFGSARVEAERRLDPLDNAFLASLVNGQLGVVGHTEAATAAVRSSLFSEIATLALPLPVPPSVEPRAPARLGPPGVAVSVGKDMRFPDGLERLSRLARIELFGASEDLAAVLPQGPPPWVRVTTDPTDHELEMLFQRIDVLVNPPASVTLEASAITLNAMRRGVPVAVLAQGWHDDLPDETVIKADSEEQLLRSVEHAVAEPGLRSSIGAAARSFVDHAHGTPRYAADLDAFITQVLSHPPHVNGQVAETIRSQRSVKAVIEGVNRALTFRSRSAN